MCTLTSVQFDDHVSASARMGSRRGKILRLVGGSICEKRISISACMCSLLYKERVWRLASSPSQSHQSMMQATIADVVGI